MPEIYVMRQLVKVWWLPLLGMVLLGTGCRMGWKTIRYNKPDLDDYEIWDERTVHREGAVHEWIDATEQGIPAFDDWAQGEKWYRPGMTPDQFFKKTGTTSFLVLRHDTLLYEFYAPDISPETRLNSFSMAKPYVSTLIGIAIGEGHITSIDQSIGDFLPEFNDSTRCALKIRHLLQMTSGIKARDGNLDPWGTTARLYYGDELERLVDKIEFKYPPGTRWKYQNINIQLLGMVLTAATGKSVGEYLEEKIWRPLGMEGDAGWSTYEDGVEKSFCCLNARTRDFARFGQLLARKGKWRGQQLIPEEWIYQCTALDTLEAARQRYQFCFYTTVEQEDFFLEGLLGQHTYICPSTQTVIVRTGNRINPSVPWYDMFKVLAGMADKPAPVELAPDRLAGMEGTWVFGLSNFSDSLMWGRQVEVEAVKEGLRVKSGFNKTWIASPSSDSTYFNLEFARRWVVRYGADGQPERIRWTRRGNKWWLMRKEVFEKVDQKLSESSQP